MAKVRISKKLLKEYPQDVQDYIAQWTDYVKSATIKHETAPYKLFNGEGYRFHVHHGNSHMQLETVSEFTLGAAGLNHDICGYTMIPAGTIIVQISYYAGYHMTIYHIGYPEIA